jgi:hypothetical protein
LTLSTCSSSAPLGAYKNVLEEDHKAYKNVLEENQKAYKNVLEVTDQAEWEDTEMGERRDSTSAMTGGEATEQFCLRWNDFHSNITSAFSEIRDDDDFLDVTLVCDGDIVRAHKLVLSACSPLFRIMLKKNSHPQPMIFLRGIRFPDMVAILNFMYHGEVNVNQEDLQQFLAAAEELRIKGLSQANTWPEAKSDRNDRNDTSNTVNTNQVPKKKTNSGGSTHSTGQPPAKRPRPEDKSSPGVSPVSTPVSAKTPEPDEDEALPSHDPPQLSVKPEFSSKEMGLIAAMDEDRENHSNSNHAPNQNNLLDSIAAVQNFAFGQGFEQNAMAPQHSAAYNSPQHLMSGMGAQSQMNNENNQGKGLLQFLGQNNVSSAAANAIMMQRLLGHGYELHPLGSRKDNDPLAHIKVARSSKGWHCPQCIHISSTKGNLKSHIVAGRHKVYTEKPFGCQYCDRSYGTKQSLQVHISTNHRAERDAEYQALSKSLGMKSFPESPNMSPGPLNNSMRASPQHMMTPLKISNHLNMSMNFVDQLKELNNMETHNNQSNNGENGNNDREEEDDGLPVIDDQDDDLAASLTPQAASESDDLPELPALVMANVDEMEQNGLAMEMAN